MSKDPAVLFYTSDFLTGTSFFDYDERGRYITLLCEQHQNGHIPENHMFDIIGTERPKIWGKFKKDENGLWYNQRMEDETNKRKSFCESRRKSIGFRWDKNDKPLSGKKINPLRTYIHTDIRMDNGNDNRIKDVIEVKEEEMQEEKQRKIIPPKIEWVIAYCIERNNSIDPQYFYDHYTAIGWVPKGSKIMMKDWQATIRTWEKNNVSSGRNGKTGLSGSYSKNNISRPGYDRNGNAIGAAAKPGEFDEGIITLEGVRDH